MSTITAMLMFSFAMSFTPGPVNLVALSSGVTFGFAKTLGFVLGATVGFIALLSATGLGLGLLIDQNGLPMSVLRYTGAGYLSFIGYKIFTTEPELARETASGSLPTFMQGFVMQWLNFKAWLACLTGCSVFQVFGNTSVLGTFLSLYFLVCLLGISFWALVGNNIRRYFVTARRRRHFAVSMGTLVIATSLMVLI